MNVGFILDSSANLKKDDFDAEKLFMMRLAASFGVSVNGSKASVIPYSDVANISIKFNDHQDIQSFWDTSDKIPLMNSKNRIDKALALADKDMFTMANGAKPMVTNLLIILTTGTQSNDADAEDPVAIAEGMVKSGVNIITVGIGSNVQEDRLGAISGDEANVFMAGSFADLEDPVMVEKINKLACQTGNVP